MVMVPAIVIAHSQFVFVFANPKVEKGIRRSLEGQLFRVKEGQIFGDINCRCHCCFAMTSVQPDSTASYFIKRFLPILLRLSGSSSISELLAAVLG